jgi:hypothetical protein
LPFVDMDGEALSAVGKPGRMTLATGWAFRMPTGRWLAILADVLPPVPPVDSAVRRREPTHSDPARPADGVVGAPVTRDLPIMEPQVCGQEVRPTEARRVAVASRVMPHLAREAAIPPAQRLRIVGLDRAPLLHMRLLLGKVTPRLTLPTEGLQEAAMLLEALQRLAAAILEVDQPLAALTLGAEVDTRLVEAATVEATLAAPAVDMAAVVVMAADKAFY